MNDNRRTTAGAAGAVAPRDRRRTALIAGALALASLAVVAVVSNIDTALARFSASTTNEGSWIEAGAIEISTSSNATGVSGDPSEGDGGGDAERAALAIDADGLAPGRVVERCIVTTYQGSIDDARIRAFGRRDGGSGLERYLETVVEIGSGDDRECADFAAERDVFTGTLGELHERHDSWASGLTIADSLASGDSVTMRIAVEVRSDNRAQGLDTEFWLVLEARP